MTFFRGQDAGDLAVRRGAGHVDYSLARRATIRAVRGGRVSRMEVCDAHPDLIRAARYSGEAISESCPLCEQGSLVLVKYVFSDALPKRENGMVWTREDVGPLLELPEARVYTVEVCPDCSWNHLRTQLALTGRSRKRNTSSR